MIMHNKCIIRVTLCNPVLSFKKPWKCSIFGVCCKAIPCQVNFLVDEAVRTGKGANSTISLVHYFFKNFGLGKTNAYIHSDNCAGQNENNYFLWYYAWRVIVGLHWSILYSFLVADHTKFSPGWCFGLAKQAVHKTFILDLFELAHTIDNSTVTGVNVSQPCGLHDGSVLIPTHDWASFFEKYFKKLPGVKEYHHFCLSNEFPGWVFCKRYVDSEEVEFDLLRDPTKLPPYTLPPIINPAGLNLERKKYLYKEIRQFCKPNSADLVAPKPWNGKQCWKCKLHSLPNNKGFKSYTTFVPQNGGFERFGGFCIDCYYMLWEGVKGGKLIFDSGTKQIFTQKFESLNCQIEHQINWKVDASCHGIQ